MCRKVALIVVAVVVVYLLLATLESLSSMDVTVVMDKISLHQWILRDQIALSIRQRWLSCQDRWCYRISVSISSSRPSSTNIYSKIVLIKKQCSRTIAIIVHSLFKQNSAPIKPIVPHKHNPIKKTTMTAREKIKTKFN